MISGFICASDSKKCADGLQCYNDYRQCDGYFDCRDKSDESEEFCRGFLLYSLNYIIKLSSIHFLIEKGLNELELLL